jgi:hypothetical protein
MTPLSRREFLKLSGAGATGLMLSQSLGVTSAGATLVPAQCLWGAFADPWPECSDDTDGCGPEDLMPAVYAFESTIRRKLGMTRHYLRWELPMPTPAMVESAAGGRVPFVDWRPQRQDTGAFIRWADIATGLQDDWITQQATSMLNWNKHAYLVFNHEPENDSADCGSPEEFQAAFAHIKRLFVQVVGVKKLKWVCTLVRGTYQGLWGGASTWFPKQATLVGVDGYNRGNCNHKWESFDSIFAAAHDFSVATNREMIVEEWGSVEPDACGGGVATETKGDWIRAAGETIKTWGNVRAVIYTNAEATFKGNPVNFKVTTSTGPTGALSAYRHVGADPYFNKQKI